MSEQGLYYTESHRGHKIKHLYDYFCYLGIAQETLCGGLRLMSKSWGNIPIQFFFQYEIHLSLLSLIVFDTFLNVNCRKKNCRNCRKGKSYISFPFPFFLLQSSADVVQGGESAPKQLLFIGKQLAQEVHIGCRARPPLLQPAQGIKQ